MTLHPVAQAYQDKFYATTFDMALDELISASRALVTVLGSTQLKTISYEALMGMTTRLMNAYAMAEMVRARDAANTPAARSTSPPDALSGSSAPPDGSPS